MKAAVLNGPGEFQLVDKPVPRPGSGEVLVRVKYCGVCSSDLHAFNTGFSPSGMTIGHEYAGVVTLVGPESEPWRPGQRVTGNNIISCGDCPNCRRGRDHHCSTMRRLGVTDEGAMAEYVLVPAGSLFLLQETVPLEWGTLAEPLSLALHGINILGVSVDDTAVIQGAGTIGLCVLAELKRRGLKDILVIEPDPVCAQTALAMGASSIVDPRGSGTLEKVAALTGGRGAGMVFECAGIPATISAACELARQGGTVTILDSFEHPATPDFQSPLTREVQVVTACGKTDAEFKEAACLIAARRIDLSPLITRLLPLESAADAFTLPGKTIIQCNN